MAFLCLIEEMKPIGSEEWDHLTCQHAKAFPPGRDVNSFQRKYATCYRKTHPTHNLHCPEEVCLAKHVKYLVGDRANIGKCMMY